jgi:pimeloyl-ACP methyl ester carboxylesterase
VQARVWWTSRQVRAPVSLCNGPCQHSHDSEEDDMARIILVHGAWGNATGWARIVPLLEAKGHRVEALDLPGHGRSPVPPETVGQAEYVAAVLERLAEGPPAMLVGHSMGGIVVAQVAARVPDRVTKGVYVAALLPRDGESLVGLIRQQEAPGVQAAVRPGPVKGTTVLDPSAAAALFPDASPRDAEAAMSAMSPQSSRAQMEGAVIGPGFAKVPRAYVLCTQDRVVTPDLQRQMIAATPCEAVIEMECGHVPQLTQPVALARILHGVAEA